MNTPSQKIWLDLIAELDPAAITVLWPVLTSNGWCGRMAIQNDDYTVAFDDRSRTLYLYLMRPMAADGVALHRDELIRPARALVDALLLEPA